MRTVIGMGFSKGIMARYLSRTPFGGAPVGLVFPGSVENNESTYAKSVQNLFLIHNCYNHNEIINLNMSLAFIGNLFQNALNLMSTRLFRTMNLISPVKAPFTLKKDITIADAVQNTYSLPSSITNTTVISHDKKSEMSILPPHVKEQRIIQREFNLPVVYYPMCAVYEYENKAQKSGRDYLVCIPRSILTALSDLSAAVKGINLYERAREIREYSSRSELIALFESTKGSKLDSVGDSTIHHTSSLSLSNITLKNQSAEIISDNLIAPSLNVEPKPSSLPISNGIKPPQAFMLHKGAEDKKTSGRSDAMTSERHKETTKNYKASPRNTNNNAVIPGKDHEQIQQQETKTLPVRSIILPSSPHEQVIATLDSDILIQQQSSIPSVRLLRGVRESIINDENTLLSIKEPQKQEQTVYKQRLLHKPIFMQLPNEIVHSDSHHAKSMTFRQVPLKDKNELFQSEIKAVSKKEHSYVTYRQKVLSSPEKIMLKKVIDNTTDNDKPMLTHLYKETANFDGHIKPHINEQAKAVSFKHAPATSNKADAVNESTVIAFPKNTLSTKAKYNNDVHISVKSDTKPKTITLNHTPIMGVRDYFKADNKAVIVNPKVRTVLKQRQKMLPSQLKVFRIKTDSESPKNVYQLDNSVADANMKRVYSERRITSIIPSTEKELNTSSQNTVSVYHKPQRDINIPTINNISIAQTDVGSTPTMRLASRIDYTSGIYRVRDVFPENNVIKNVIREKANVFIPRNKNQTEAIIVYPKSPVKGDNKISERQPEPSRDIEFIKRTSEQHEAASVKNTLLQRNVAVNLPGQSNTAKSDDMAAAAEKQINMIAEKVYSALERRLRTERLRRGTI